MSKEEILQTIKDLSKSSGTYTRIYNYLMSLPKDRLDYILETYEKANFSSPVDLILYIES